LKAKKKVAEDEIVEERVSKLTTQKSPGEE